MWWVHTTTLQPSVRATRYTTARPISMGKFGRHSDFIVQERDGNGASLFVVPYTEIKELARSAASAGSSSHAAAPAPAAHSCENYINNIKGATISLEDAPLVADADAVPIFDESTHREYFEQQWRTTLDRVGADFGSAITDFWTKIFRTIVVNNNNSVQQSSGCGALPGVAISLYVDAVGREAAQELLARLKQIHKAAYHNTEALRKLVKKFDKKKSPDEEALSPVLLPILYTANFTIGQPTLEEGIALLRELLEATAANNNGTTMSAFSSFDDDGYDSDKSRNEQIVEDRQSELEWLLRLTCSMEESELAKLVAHRGFHSVQDYVHRRPNENSLTAYETAWTHGVHICECDIALTKDEKLILSHDEDFRRLALNKMAPISNKKIHELTFKELLALPLTSASRPPLLIDVLRSASAIGDTAQLAIEIKPGNEPAVTALVRMLTAHPEFLPCIPCIMSFDAYTMHQLRRELWAMAATISATTAAGSAAANHGHPQLAAPLSHRRNRSSRLSFSSGLISNLTASPAVTGRKMSIAELGDFSLGEPAILAATAAATVGIALPKLMMLTVEGPPKTPNKLRVGIHDLSPLESSMVSKDGCLDGVYLEYQPVMLEPAGLAALRKLGETYCVGVWNRGGDPDNYQTFAKLIHEGNVTYVNTDLPDTFRVDVPKPRGHRIRRMPTA